MEITITLLVKYILRKVNTIKTIIIRVKTKTIVVLAVLIKIIIKATIHINRIKASKEAIKTNITTTTIVIITIIVHGNKIKTSSKPPVHISMMTSK